MTEPIDVGGGDPGPVAPVPPLPDELLRRIEAITAPPASEDFWVRLQLAADAEPEAGQSDDSTPAPGDRHGRRSFLVLAAAVVALVVAGALLLRPDGDSIRTTDPAAQDQPAASPDDPENGPASSDQGPVLRVESTDPARPDAGDPDPTPPPTTTSSTSPTSTSTSTSTGPSSTSSTGGSDSVARPDPIVIEAETVETATVGQATGDGWNIFSAGRIEQRVELSAGRYLVVVEAHGFSRTSSRPEMELLLDGQPVGSVLVTADTYRPHRFEIEVETGGVHRIGVAFTNDPDVPTDDVDLRIDRIVISPR